VTRACCEPQPYLTFGAVDTLNQLMPHPSPFTFLPNS
jgi:hypothetical protein